MKIMGSKDISGTPNQKILDEYDAKLKEYVDKSSKPKHDNDEYYDTDKDDGVFVVVMMFGIFAAVVALGILYFIVKKELGT